MTGPRRIKPRAQAADTRTSAPAHAGDTFQGNVGDLASDGDAILHHPSGLVVFVPGLWAGEAAEVKITSIQGRHARGRILQILTPTAQRQAPVCSHHGHQPGNCGGCPWMFVDYPAQLVAKQNRVQRCLQRLDISTDCLCRIRPSAAALGYRIRAQLKTDGSALGFVSPRSQQLAPIQDCVVLTDANRGLLQQMLASLPRKDWRPRRRGQLTTLDIDEQQSLHTVSVNRRLPFAQANQVQNDYMREWLAARLGQDAKYAGAIELFCGAGNFTRVLCQAGITEILAADNAADAIGKLRIAGLPGVQTRCCNLFESHGIDAITTAMPGAEVLLLDPPRDGLKQRDLLLDHLPFLRKVLYVSCDLATWQRDAESLLKRNFLLEEVQPVDLFPQTPHVELLSCFTRATGCCQPSS